MGASTLKVTDRKQLLKDPSAWVRQHRVVVGKRALAELIEQRENLQADYQVTVDRSRALSKAIGQAKKQGASIDELLADKRGVSAREKSLRQATAALEDDIVELLSLPSGEHATNEKLIPALDDETVDLAAVRIFPLTEERTEAWDDFVEQHPLRSVYHLVAIKSIIESSFNHESIYLMALDEDERVLGVLPLVRLKSRLFGDYMVSQPFFNYGGVLALNSEVRSMLLSHAEGIAKARGSAHIEYRDREAIDGLPVRTDKVAMWLELPESENALWQQIGAKVRAQVKRGARFELSAHSGGSEFINEFYTVFSENMRDLGTPVYGKPFFKAVLDSALPDKRLVIVRYNEKPVSAALLLGYGDRLEVPWASTLRSANVLDANMFLYWELLRQACAGGYRYFDFGRSTQGAPTYRFKKQWGAEPVQLYWHYWLSGGGEPPKLNPDNPKYRLVIAAWQRLPIWLTRIIGPHIVKYLP